MPDSTDTLRSAARELEDLLERGATEELLEHVARLHASDVADVLEHIETEEQRLRVLELLPAELASEALSEMEEEEHPAELLARMEPERIARIVEELEDDDAADLIGDLEPDEQERILESVPPQEAEEIRGLLEYPEDTAGGLMTRDLLAVRSNHTAARAISQLRERAHERDDFYTIFVVEPDGHLAGIVTLQDLVLADPSTRISELVKDPPAVVTVDMDQEEVGRILARYNLPSIGVVDGEGRLVGRITFDDVIDVVEAETTEDILRFAAVSEVESLRGSTLGAVRSRLPWLALNLLTAVAASSVVYVFQSTIERLAILAAVMPVIAGMGGNAGTQALAVTIRRIATSKETMGQRWSVVWKELVVGIVNGLFIGLLVAAVAMLLPDAPPRLGLVVMIAMWGNLIVASTVGAFFPILLESMGVDPAIASSIFVTTFTDLCGFFLLLGMGSRMLL